MSLHRNENLETISKTQLLLRNSEVSLLKDLNIPTDLD